MQKIGVVVVAAGSGTRAGSTHDAPKQYRSIGGQPLLAHTLERIVDVGAVTHVVTVIGAGQRDLYDGLDLDHPKLLPAVIGGDTRQVSVLRGLEALSAIAPDFVLIHDGARPFVTEKLFDAVIDGLSEAEGALPVTVVTDTIKRSADGKTVGGTEDRTQLFAAQTPQGFHYEAILAAHRKAIEFGDGFTDDAAIAEWAGLSVALAQGDPRNIKVTLPEDFERAERILAGDTKVETRVGSGFDVHAFAPDGDAVMLGNISIPHTARLSGHSDADVVLHALSDAIYGALADGDIGKHFPPSDMQWKGADSSIFLEHASKRVEEQRGRLVHLDVTIICEQPKIGPHVDAMRARIAEIAGVSIDRVGVKATTSERLGFTGRQEGIAAQAIATIELPRG